jgi:hypothetical protein
MKLLVLKQVILLIGYFVLENKDNQDLLGRGEQTLIQKIIALPFRFFCDKALIDVLFPTIISAI